MESNRMTERSSRAALEAPISVHHQIAQSYNPYPITIPVHAATQSKYWALHDPLRATRRSHFVREKQVDLGFPVDKLWGQAVEKKDDILVIFLLRKCSRMSDECAREVRGTSARERHRL
jgi:hypothetical protein